MGKRGLKQIRIARAAGRRTRRTSELSLEPFSRGPRDRCGRSHPVLRVGARGVQRKTPGTAHAMARRMLIRTSVSALVSVLAVLAGSGCCDGVQCGPCPTAIFLRVTDATTRDAITGLKVTGAPGTCDDQGVCLLGSGAGSYHLHIEAPGYVATDRTVDVPAVDEGGCCACGFNQAAPSVTLRKA